MWLDVVVLIPVVEEIPERGKISGMYYCVGQGHTIKLGHYCKWSMIFVIVWGHRHGMEQSAYMLKHICRLLTNEIVQLANLIHLMCLVNILLCMHFHFCRLSLMQEAEPRWMNSMMEVSQLEFDRCHYENGVRFIS